MSKEINLTEVRRDLPALVDEVSETQQSVVITRHGKPVAKLCPYTEADESASAYPLRGLPLEVSDDFDDELPQMWEALE